VSDFDFTFRGETLESHGYMLCEWDSRSSASAVTTDSQKSFSSIMMFEGKRQPIIYFTYKDTLSIKMSICKLEDSESQLITPSEAAVIKRWLGSPVPQELTFGDERYSGYHWTGVFNIEEVHYALGCIGFDLTFVSSAPFGYKDRVELSGSVAANGTISIVDTSDEEGYIYPDMTIKLQAAGDLKITNMFDQRETIINGCANGETLTFTNLLQITSSNSNHILGNNFNYRFMRINNEYGNTTNQIKFNLPCTYSIAYNPIAKVVFT